MKTSSDKLHVLISALDRSEKRFFKLFSMREKGSKAYLQIFDAVAGQKIYDEEGIRRKFRDRPFARFFAQEKKRLYGLVLKSLVAYHSEKRENKTSLGILKVGILYEKALYDQCSSLLALTRKEAEQFNQYTALVEISVWEYILMITRNLSGISASGIRKKFSEMPHYITLLSEQMEYYYYNSIIVSLINSIGIPRSKEEEEKWTAALKKIRLGANDKPKTFDSEFYHYTNNGNVLFFKDFDAAASLPYYRKANLLFHERKEMREMRFTNFFLSEISLIGSLIQTRKFSEVQERLDGFAAVCEKIHSNRVRQKALGVKHQLTVFYLLETGKYNAALRELETAFRLIAEKKIILRDTLSHVIMNYYGIAISLVQRDFRKALKYLRVVLSEKKYELRRDLYANIRLMQVIVYYELNDPDLFQSGLKSVYRYLHQNKKLYRFEKLLFTILKKAFAGEYTSVDEQTIFETIKEKLAVIMKDKYEKRALRFFYYADWVESKVRKRPLEEILIRKYFAKNSLRS